MSDDEVFFLFPHLPTVPLVKFFSIPSRPSSLPNFGKWCQFEITLWENEQGIEFVCSSAKQGMRLRGILLTSF